MGDYSQEWAADEARKLEAHVGRTVARIRALAEKYTGLGGALAAGGKGAPDPDALHVYTPAGPRLPLRVEVVDVMRDVEMFVAYFLPLVRGTLRIDRGVTFRTRELMVAGGLGTMAAGLGGIYAEAPGLGDDISRGAWDLERRAGWIVGDQARPFPLLEPCAECGVASLWVVPDRMLLRCGNPECGAQSAVNSHGAVHSVG